MFSQNEEFMATLQEASLKVVAAAERRRNEAAGNSEETQGEFRVVY